MKKIFTYIGIAASVAAILSSCGKSNVPSVFDDSNAFVAFNTASVNIDEDSKDTLRIPVTLASVAGLGERISYTVTDSTAKQGVNFTLVDAAATLTFDSKNRMQYIEIVPKYDGVYTGDLVFTITLKASANVNLGAASVCTVKINDVDHPLTPILGNWTVSGTFHNGAKTFTLTILKDDNDDHMVWFYNLFGLDGWKGTDTMYYGNVSDDLKTIVIPFGQEMNEYQYQGHPIYLLGVDSSMNVVETGNATVTITFGEQTTLTFSHGFYWYIDTLGYLAYSLPGATGVKN